jgi:hypothetical protein
MMIDMNNEEYNNLVMMVILIEYLSSDDVNESTKYELFNKFIWN